MINRSSYVPFAQEAYDSIQKMILKGHLKPGVRLIESQLSKRLGVSRTPIRESIRRLAAEGLVEIWPKGGARVSELTTGDFEEIYEIREVLECLAAEKATPLLKDKEIDTLRRLAEDAEKALLNRDISRMSQLNSKFHKIIWKASRNRRLFKLIDILQTNLSRHREFILGIPKEAEEAIKGHWEIIDGLSRRDQKAVRRAMQKHIFRVRRILSVGIEK